MDRKKLFRYGRFILVVAVSLLALYIIRNSPPNLGLKEIALIPVALAGFTISTSAAVITAAFFSFYSFLSANLIDGTELAANLLHSLSLLILAVATGSFASYLKSKNLKELIEKRQLESLNKISTNFFASLEPAVVYDQFTRELRRLLAADGILLLKLTDQQTLKVLAEENAEELINNGFLRALSQFLKKVDQGKIVQLTAEELNHESSSFKSFFIAPVIENEIVVLASKKKRQLSGDEIRLLNNFLDESHLALTGAKYYTIKEQQSRLINVIAELNKAAASLAETDELIRAAIRKVFEYTNADLASFFTFKGEQAELFEYIARPEFNRPETIQELEKVLSFREYANELNRQLSPLIVKGNVSYPASLKELSERTGASVAIYLPLIIKEKNAGGIIVLFQKEPLQELNHEFLNSLSAEVSMVFYNSKLISEIKNLTLKTVEAIAAAFDAANPYTKGHSQKVAKYATEIAKIMGLSLKEIREIQYAALLHDMGRIFIEGEVLNAPRKLTDKEVQKIRKVPAISSKIVEKINFFSSIVPLIYHHKEHYDGSGYPSGLKGETIPLGSRIIHVAESYVAMTSDRPHRPALSITDAIRELKKNSGHQFDPRVVNAMIKVLKKENPSLLIDTVA